MNLSNKIENKFVNNSDEMNKSKLEHSVEALKAGDSSAFDYVYDCTYKAVYFAVYGVLADKHLAEDITQETYVTALNKLGSYAAGSNFIGWIITIAKRLAINEFNRRKGRGEFSVDFVENESLYGEYRVEDKVDNTTLELARKLLKEDEYAIVTMCAIAGYKRREVAEILDIPIGTVTWKYNEALKKLKNNL